MIINKIMKFSLMIVFAVVFLMQVPLLALAKVEGDLYQQQMENYERMKENFPDVFEKNITPKEEIKGKSSQDLYLWQLKPYERTQEEFDLPNN